MNKFTFLCFLVFFVAHAAAQETDPLAVTLPNGRVMHFQTDEQKAKFVAARERMASAGPAPSPTPAQAQTSGASSLSATDSAAQGTGKVNVTAPTFTADYYMFAPETWEGKEATISVAYVRRDTNATRTDGMIELEAHTYGTLPGTREHRSGGYISLVATPAAAQRILTLAGTRYQSALNGTKITLFKGTFKKSTVGTKGYYLFVDK